MGAHQLLHLRRYFSQSSIGTIQLLNLLYHLNLMFFFLVPESCQVSSCPSLWRSGLDYWIIFELYTSANTEKFPGSADLYAWVGDPMPDLSVWNKIIYINCRSEQKTLCALVQVPLKPFWLRYSYNANRDLVLKLASLRLHKESTDTISSTSTVVDKSRLTKYNPFSSWSRWTVQCISGSS